MTNTDTPIFASMTDDPCSNPNCAEKHSHPARYHFADADLARIADTKKVRDLFADFYQNLWDMVVELDLPLPDTSHAEDEDDDVDEYHDWATNAVIRICADAGAY